MNKFFLTIVFTVGVASPLTVNEALDVLEREQPHVVQELRRKAPTVMPTLRHRHRSVLGKIGKFGFGVAIGVLAVVAFAILHDQYTARLSKEYFSEGFHKDSLKKIAPRWYNFLAQKDSPTWWANGWGVVAGWPIGLLGGLLLNSIALLGNTTPISLKEMGKPAFITMITTLAASVFGAAAPQMVDKYFKVEDLLRYHPGGMQGIASRTALEEQWKYAQGKNRLLQLADDAREGRLPDYFGVDVDLSKDQRDRYYRAAKAHRMLYYVGLRGLLLMALWAVWYRFWRLAQKYNAEKVIAREWLEEIILTGKSKTALEKVKNHLWS